MVVRATARAANEAERHLKEVANVSLIFRAGAGEPRLHTGFANAERLYCFGDTEFLHVPRQKFFYGEKTNRYAEYLSISSFI